MAKAITKFSPDVIQKLQYYVYRLVDPRNNNTFYIGKGKGNRIFQHVNGAEKTKDEDDSLKIKTIKEIQKNGKKVIQIIHRWGLSEATAFELEAALIDAYECLTNIVSGKRSDVSPSSVEQIQESLEIKETATFKQHKVLIIKITQESITKQKNDIYEAVRKAWKINPKKANEADYILAVCNGVIKEVFILTGKKWQKSFADASRYEFEGKPASPDIQDSYKNKLIPQKYREKSMANPIHYSWNVKSSKIGKT
jgi:hypothetical protein